MSSNKFEEEIKSTSQIIKHIPESAVTTRFDRAQLLVEKNEKMIQELCILVEKDSVVEKDGRVATRCSSLFQDVTLNLKDIIKEYHELEDRESS